jgi:hypothetical protein
LYNFANNTIKIDIINKYSCVTNINKMDKITTNRLLKFYKKNFKLKSNDIKSIRHIPNLKVIKTVNVTKKDLQTNIYILNISNKKNINFQILQNNAISNININFEYVKKYDVLIGGVQMYRDQSLKNSTQISQNNLQIIPIVALHDLRIVFEFKVEEYQLNDNCYLFSFDIIEYGRFYRMYDCMHYMINPVQCKQTTKSKIHIPVHIDCQEHFVANANINENIPAPSSKIIEVNIHNLQSMLIVWFIDENCNKYYLELIDNTWSYKYLKYLCVISNIFIRFKKGLKDEYIVFDATFYNCLSNNELVSQLDYTW